MAETFWSPGNLLLGTTSLFIIVLVEASGVTGEDVDQYLPKLTAIAVGSAALPLLASRFLLD